MDRSREELLAVKLKPLSATAEGGFSLYPLGGTLPREEVRSMRDLVFERSDGSSVLVSIWDDGRATMAEKSSDGGVWSAPSEPVLDERRESTAVSLLRELVSSDIINLDEWEDDMPLFVEQIRKAIVAFPVERPEPLPPMGEPGIRPYHGARGRAPE